MVRFVGLVVFFIFMLLVLSIFVYTVCFAQVPQSSFGDLPGYHPPEQVNTPSTNRHNMNCTYDKQKIKVKNVKGNDFDIVSTDETPHCKSN